MIGAVGDEDDALFTITVYAFTPGHHEGARALIETTDDVCRECALALLDAGAEWRGGTDEDPRAR